MPDILSESGHVLSSVNKNSVSLSKCRGSLTQRTCKGFTQVISVLCSVVCRHFTNQLGRSGGDSGVVFGRCIKRFLLPVNTSLNRCFAAVA